MRSFIYTSVLSRILSNCFIMQKYSTALMQSALRSERFCPTAGSRGYLTIASDEKNDIDSIPGDNSQLAPITRISSD